MFMEVNVYEGVLIMVISRNHW